MPALVSMVLVEETGVWCAGRLAAIPMDLDEQVLAETCPAGVTEYVDDFILPMLPEYCFRPSLLGSCSQQALLALLARLGLCPHLTLPEYCFRPFLLGYRSQQALLGRCPHLTKLDCCFRPFLLEYCFQ